MRASEVCGLELKDVDLKNNEIVIRRLKGCLADNAAASGRARPALAVRSAVYSAIGSRNAASTLASTSSRRQKSGKLNRSTFYRVFSDAAERAGLPADKRHPHVLKHSLAVALVEANVNLATVRVALGHKCIASTAIYAMPSDESAGRAVIAALASL